MIGECAPGPFVTVVSGLPRSGTSMMMQMLSAGGLPLLQDDVRPPDPDNPRGYFEYEPVKRLKRDRSWVGDAVGSGVKIVAPLLSALPEGPRYRIVFMERDLSEVIASQDVMLARLGHGSGPSAAADIVRDVFDAEVRRVPEWAGSRQDVALLRVSYAETVRDPRRTGEALERFLVRDLSVERMADAVDPALHRQRGAS